MLWNRHAVSGVLVVWARREKSREGCRGLAGRCRAETVQLGGGDIVPPGAHPSGLALSVLRRVV